MSFSELIEYPCHDPYTQVQLRGPANEVDVAWIPARMAKTGRIVTRYPQGVKSPGQRWKIEACWSTAPRYVLDGLRKTLRGFGHALGD